jgi:hypothetical protein
MERPAPLSASAGPAEAVPLAGQGLIRPKLSFIIYVAIFILLAFFRQEAFSDQAEEAQRKAEIKAYVSSLIRLEAKTEEVLFPLTEEVNAAMKNNDTATAVNKLLEGSSLLERQIKALKSLAVPVEAQGLQRIAVAYYQSMQEVQVAALKHIAQIPQDKGLLSAATEKMADLETQFRTQCGRFTKEYSLPPVYSWEYDLETDSSLEETVQSLIQDNKRLNHEINLLKEKGVANEKE